MVYVVTSIDISTLFNNIRNNTDFKNNVLLVTTIKIALISCIHFNDLFIIDFEKPVTVFGSPESFLCESTQGSFDASAITVCLPTRQTNGSCRAA